MKYTPDFLAKDQSRRLLTRGLSHDYKRVLATLSRRVDEIRGTAEFSTDEVLINRCDLIKSIIGKISHRLDEIGDSIDRETTSPATAIVSGYKTAILRDMRNLSNYSAHIQSRIQTKRAAVGTVDLHGQCQRAEKQIKALINLPFNDHDVKYRTVNIKNETQRIIEDLYDMFRKYEIDYRKQIVNKLSSTITTDQLLFTICVSNVLTNSVVHSDKRDGLLILIEESIQQREARDFIAISISDNGIGVSQEDAKIIFHLFKQGSRATTSDGTGVGLPFARAAARMLGGDLTLTNDHSPGAQFILSLPLQP